MPALDADIVAATREAVTEAWSDSAVKTRYPNARDGQADPAEGFFDSPADAATAIAARAALFGTERRRFMVSVQDLLWPDPLTGIPIIALTDVEQVANANHIAARIEVDLENETTGFEVFG